MTRRRFADAISLLLFLSACVFGQVGLEQLIPLEIRQLTGRCIQSIYNGDFKQAEAEARKTIKAYPDHPAGYFFYAVSLDVWMEYYQSNDKEEEFYKYCDLAILRGEKLMDTERDNPWVRFFIGGADGYKGTYESRQGRYITAFRYGWKGVSVLMDLQRKYPQMNDLNYGIGSYEYWRSAMTRTLVWMPGVEDKRDTGIVKIQDAMANGILTRTPSAAALLPIYCNEKRFAQALELSTRMSDTFPNSLVWYWGEGEALYGLRRLAEAEKTYRYILSRVEAESYDNHCNAVRCHFWLARIALDQKNYTQSIAECNRMKYYQLSDDVRKRLRKCFDDAEDVRKQAMAARARSAQPQLVP